MKNNKAQHTHYLSFTYKCLITNKIIHCILFLAEIVFIFLQILEIHYNSYKSLNNSAIKIFSFITPVIKCLNKLNIYIKFAIYIIIIIIETIFSYIPNYISLSKNKFWNIMINLIEIIFYRIGALFMFHFLFSFNKLYLIIGIIITIPFIIILIISTNRNNLFDFFFSFVEYPYDSFSKIIDNNLLAVNIFISISSLSTKNLSKFFFILALSILLFLQIYLTYILFYKSYLLMNNVTLNKIRYSILLSNCIIILFILITKNSELSNFYFLLCISNIMILSFLLVIIFYDPYDYVKFDKDDNEENALFYFFVLERGKNKNLLLEKKVKEHLNRCGKCNLCKKFQEAKVKDKFENIDLYNIIYNNKNFALNLMNKIIRWIRKNGKSSIAGNCYFLINLIYIYSFGVTQKDYCFFLNTELFYQMINSENNQYFEDYKIYLNRIKYINNFIIKAKKIIETFYKIMDEKKLEKKCETIFKFETLLEELKYKEIKNSNSNIGNYNNTNGNSSDKTLNCSNLLTICSIFYEELYNESISNSRIYIRDSQNLLEDLINNNLKNHKLITLEINTQNFQVTIIRAGGFLNKYENRSLFDLFPEVFKSKQISLMKKILIRDNSDNSQNKNKKNENDNNKSNNHLKNKDNEFQYINFYFLIELKEGNDIYFQLLKLELNLVILKSINTIIYLNGIYKIDKDIIITEQKKSLEYLFHYGNKEQLNMINEKSKENKILIKQKNGNKYIWNKKIIEDENALIGFKHYKIYHFLLPSKKNIFLRTNKNEIQDIHNLAKGFKQDTINNPENSDKLLFNDVASQSSSVTSSISRNNFMLYNRGNKQGKSSDDITKNFKAFKYILWITILITLIALVIEYIILKLYHSNLAKEVCFYLNLSEYYKIYSRMFCSILSLSCIGVNPETEKCENKILKYSNYQMIINNGAKSNITEDNEEAINALILLLSSLFVNFEELLFKQEEIMAKMLEDIKETILDDLAKINQKKFIKLFQDNLYHYKITQDFDDNNTINFILKKENITFSDAILLITSRCEILSKDINDLRYPIYFLNKTANNQEDPFININKKNKINPYQENFYLLLLDNEEFSKHLNQTIYKVEDTISDRFGLYEEYTKYILIINVILYLFIFIILFGYISIYLIIIFQILLNIYKFLNDKLGEIIIKDIMKKKIDNLKLLLNFYEKDINSTILDLNSIYNNYRESYNLKIKEESRLVKKENRTEKESQKKNRNIFKLFNIKYFHLFFSYSTKRNIYIYSIIMILIFMILSFGIYIIILAIFLKKKNYALCWANLSRELSKSTNYLMTNFLIMIYTNQTFSELSSNLYTKDFTSYIYYKLKDLYKAGGYISNIQDLVLFSEKTINYDCEKFYENLKDPFFLKLFSIYESKNETFKFNYTLQFFCSGSNVLSFKNYKTTYLQLFNPVENIMQNFKNEKYDDIFNFIEENNMPGLEIFFFITYVHLLDIMNTNIKSVYNSITNEINNKIDILGIIFLISIVYLVCCIYFAFSRNMNNDCHNFIQMKKIFKVCNINE